MTTEEMRKLKKEALRTKYISIVALAISIVALVIRIIQVL